MQTVLNIIFTLLAAAGILTALLGWDKISAGAHPGLNLPQGMLIVGGLMLSLVAFRLRRADAWRRAWGTMRKHWLPLLVITAVTLIALEFVLGAVDRPPLYFPPDPLQELLEGRRRRWTCDELGCRYVYDVIVADYDQYCEGQDPLPRYCILNRQGFHDTQDFAAGDDLDGRTRILALGDSFTFGSAADIGKSYVNTIEANFPQSVVWNTGIPRTGTQQALALFQEYAPILQPQLTTLGFFAGNDFSDNLLPMDIRLWLMSRKDGRVLLQLRDDDSGNVPSLDEKKTYYYRAHDVEPPANEIERAVGRTRLGSLALRLIDIVRGGGGDHPGIAREVAVTREYLRDLREAAAAQDTVLLVLLIPHPNDIGAPARLYQTAIQLMEELRLPYLDPIHALDAELDYAPKPNSHWNSAGHQKIGAMLSDCIEVFQISGDLADCEEVTMP